MNKFVTTLTTTFNKAKFQVNKHSPEILLVTGIVGLVGGAILACKATLKAKEATDEYRQEKEDIEDTIQYETEDGTLVVYKEEDKKNDILRLKVKTGLEYVKVYTPAVTITVASIVALVASNNVMRKRTAALAGAYAALDASFKNYRNRVIEAYGDKIDKEMLTGVKMEQVEQKVIDEKGKEKTEKVDVMTFDGKSGGFTRVFEKGNKYYDKSPFYIRSFLDAEEARANTTLRAEGFLFLNDIYERLGFPKTKVGQAVGWKYSPNKDCYIDFGIQMINNDTAATLTFNPHGYIFGDLEEEGE